MSYGKWKALHYKPVAVPVVVEPEPEVKQAPVRVCRICGTQLPDTMHRLAWFCSPECKEENNRRKQCKYYYQKKWRKESDGKV